MTRETCNHIATRDFQNSRKFNYRAKNDSSHVNSHAAIEFQCEERDIKGFEVKQIRNAYIIRYCLKFNTRNLQDSSCTYIVLLEIEARNLLPRNLIFS